MGRNTKTGAISIALCTYNGAAFLREQLDSIAAQTRLPDELVVCDDGSTDGTADIVRAFAREAPFPVRLNVNEANLRAYRNFEKAMSLCTGDVIFFCDQDDVWRPRKVEVLTACLADAQAEFGPDSPLLVHCDLEVVDAALRTLSPSIVRAGDACPPATGLLLANAVTGCACAFNRVLVDLASPFPDLAVARGRLWHDWWLALCAAAAGHVLYVDEPLVRYRQHGANTLGATRRSRAGGDRGALAKRIATRRQRSRDKLRAAIGLAKFLEGRLEERGRWNPQSRDHRALAVIAGLDTLPFYRRPLVAWRANLAGPRFWKKLKVLARTLLPVTPT